MRISRRLLILDGPLSGGVNQLLSILKVELPLDARKIRLHRPQMRVHALSDFFCAQAFADQPIRFQLAIGQSFDRRRPQDLPGAANTPPQKLVGHWFAQVDFTGQNVTDCSNHEVRGFQLVDIPPRRRHAAPAPRKANPRASTSPGHGWSD